MTDVLNSRIHRLKSLMNALILKNTYDFTQDFVYALADKDTKKIKDLLDSNIGQYYEQLKTIIRTFRKNKRAVLNNVQMSYSNGCLEGVNRKIKQIERTALWLF